MGKFESEIEVRSRKASRIFCIFATVELSMGKSEIESEIEVGSLKGVTRLLLICVIRIINGEI